MLVDEVALNVEELFADLAHRACHSWYARSVEVLAQTLKSLHLVAF